jgi:hypothetical protein
MMDAEMVGEDAGAGEDADVLVPRSGLTPWSALPSSDGYHDKSTTDWVRSWAHWYMSANSCDTAETDLDGSGCRLFQDPTSEVFFLASGMYLTVRTECRLPRSMAVLVPITFFIAGLTDSPLDRIMAPADLERQAREIAMTMRDLVLEVDGVDMLDADDHRIDPIEFTEVVPEEPNRLSCEGSEGVSGPVGPFYIAGYFALFPPGMAGRHTLIYGGTYSKNGVDIVDRVRTTLLVE